MLRSSLVLLSEGLTGIYVDRTPDRQQSSKSRPTTLPLHLRIRRIDPPRYSSSWSNRPTPATTRTCLVHVAWQAFRQTFSRVATQIQLDPHLHYNLHLRLSHLARH